MTLFLRTSLSLLAILLIFGCLFRVSKLTFDQGTLESHIRFRAYLSFQDPVSLFYPTATISLTDDNSTFFNAKPAAFGPSLPAEGLNRQIWIGTGFGAASLRRQHDSASREGELGCDDLPARLTDTWTSDTSLMPKPAAATESSIDLQSINITGKIVLLSRGGCGFSEKVEWAQRRGAAAVIIGDNVPGGPLVRMYAQGDVSKITIPSIFTSHTTAHLLSSLIPPSTPSDYGDGINDDSLSQTAGDSIPDSDDHPGWGDSRSDGLMSRKAFDDTNYRSESDPPYIIDTHNGLWVTLTQADMSTSPFFSTLFVLVVSPLITLALVYSMLLVRSRIRRRRWRAPKSVVERLPVRVYHHLSSRDSPVCGTPTQERCTSATPLLAANMAAGQLLYTSQDMASSPQSSSRYGSLDTSSVEKEKFDPGLAEWKRKYRGKQKECVVCLEEYIDGVSRVMSLPCGHEFHVDCITPWLTTRRRTCPICKRDVVRSLGKDPDQTRRGASDETEEEIQIQVVGTINSSQSAALPVHHPSFEQRTDGERIEHAGSIFSSFGSPPIWTARRNSPCQGTAYRDIYDDREDEHEEHEEHYR